MPPTNVINELLSQATPSSTSEQNMILWIKASTITSAQLAIDYIGNLPGVESVHLTTPKPIKFKVRLRIKYCPKQTFAERIAQEAASKGLVAKPVGVIQFKCS